MLSCARVSYSQASSTIVFYYPIVFRGYIRTFPLSSLITVLMDELHEKSGCSRCCPGLCMDQNGCSALAEAWLPNCSCTRARQSKGGSYPSIHESGRKEWGGGEQLLLRSFQLSALFIPAVQGCSPLSNCLEEHLWDGAGEGERQIHVFGNIPCPLEPLCRELSFPPWHDAARSLTEAP